MGRGATLPLRNPEDYAVRIARDWNVPASGSGFVLRFEVDAAFLVRYPPREAGGRDLVEHWVPAEELEAFNDAIRGRIRIVRSFGSDPRVGSGERDAAAA